MSEGKTLGRAAWDNLVKEAFRISGEDGHACPTWVDGVLDAHGRLPTTDPTEGRKGEPKWDRKHAVVIECLAACAKGDMKPGKGICKSALEVIRNQDLTMNVYEAEKAKLKQQLKAKSTT